MVERQIRARGIRDARVLQAFREAPRHAFVPDEVAEWAYHDVPLPIGEGQAISQPYMVAEMVAALELGPDDRVLEVGAGSGYAAAILSRLAAEVYGVERHAPLLAAARERIEALGYGNVHLRLAGDVLGWPEEAPFDAILVSAAGTKVPEALKEQLAVGGQMVIPVGEHRGVQELLRIRRGTDGWQEGSLGEVSFVPLVEPDAGDDGEGARASPPRPVPRDRPIHRAASLSWLVRASSEPFDDIDSVDLGPLLERIGDARAVLVGEASHGTSEFYRMRARITRELIERRGFTIVALEADWPDAARLDRYVRGALEPERPEAAFARFPSWMWRNREVLDFVEWLRSWNGVREGGQAGIFGLDLYSLYSSAAEVISYLERIDPAAAEVARQRYACLTPYEADPAAYGHAAVTGRYRDCEDEAVAMLAELQARQAEYALSDGRALLDATGNARVAAGATRYYRTMYYGGAESWNVRDEHMFETLEALLAFHGPASRAVVWAHNSHLGDASATEMSARGERNLGQLVRERFGDGCVLVGQGTDRGTVAAASGWDRPMEVKQVRPSHPRSYERVCLEAGVPRAILPLGGGADPDTRAALRSPRLQRAIGVVYRPETELQSHYFQARLPGQFDEWIWFEETRAVQPLGEGGSVPRLADAHPFATVDR
jgi:protein-L-isoaspartate(D-aspartate) O-methyltransferase